MGSLRILRVWGLFQLCCALIIVFSSSYSHAQQERNWLDEDNSQRSYFFYQRLEYPRDCKEIHNECPSSNSSGVFLVKPDAYPEPFEIYCSNDFELGGWTVIQRRVDGSVDFNRNWQEYKNGFGFLSSEFWLGNEKISYLTNQAKYQVRFDIVLDNGTSLFASYSGFRISDEWSQYRLTSVGDFHGNIEFSTCPPNMIFGNCSCQPSCDDPTGNSCRDNCGGNIMIEECVCLPGFLLKDGKCVLPSGCGCFISQTNSVLTAGEKFVNIDCSEKCTCENGELSCTSSYRCDSNAACRVQDGERGCYCNEGYEGDGETCADYTDCYDAYQDGHRQDGVYTILPTRWPGPPFSVFCDMTTAGGGWTVFQRRTDGVTNFYRNWADYKIGFGSVQQGNDFWLGNEQLHYLTNQKNYKLRVDFVDSGRSRYGEYTTFQTGDSSTKYRLSISGYSGDHNSGMLYANGGSFSTHDQDNDGCSYHNCAEGHRGGWWYTNNWCSECVSSSTYCYTFQTRSSCYNYCTYGNFNGDYDGVNGQSITWDRWVFCNINSAEMKIRPSSA